MDRQTVLLAKCSDAIKARLDRPVDSLNRWIDHVDGRLGRIRN